MKPVSLLAALALAGLALAGGGVAAQGSDDAAQRLGLQIDRRAVMKISAEALEATRGPDGRERVQFERGVEVVQGDLRIRCDQLEALYPKGQDGGPEQITARGAVQIEQRGVQVSCEQAVFDRRREVATCVSGGALASLRRGEDVVQGREIVFDLRDGKVTVRGGASVVVQPREETP